MSFISTATMQYVYFMEQLGHPDWKGKTVLDFGGNIGNILTDPDCSIEHHNYWCLDVSKDAIEQGKRTYPNAHFEFYNKYNFSFNPSGVQSLPIPDLGLKFDYILSYSIFSHTGRKEMTDTVRQLTEMLLPGGTLIFTFLDPDYNPSKFHQGFRDITNFELRVSRLNDGKSMEELVELNSGSEWSVLLNSSDLYVENEDFLNYDIEDKATIFSFFRPSYLESIFPDATVVAPPKAAYDPFYVAEMQHSCIIKKRQDG